MISIRRQLTRRLLRTTLGLVGLGLVALVGVAGYAVIHEFDVALRTKALAVSSDVEAGPEGVHVEFSDRFFRGFEARKPRDFFELWRPDGQLIARSESLGSAELTRPLDLTDAPRYYDCTLPTGRPGRAVAFAFTLQHGKDAGPPVSVHLVVATDREDRDETIWQLLGLAAGCGALLLGATLWAVPRVLRRELQPLDRLAEQAARIDAASLGARFPTDELPEELQPIARRLNDLLARLEQSFERERRFSGDLAHELRTPIAELRSLAECALKWPESRDGATDSEVLAIARHMESLTTGMLALARGASGQAVGPVEPVDPVQQVKSAWRPFAERAAARGLQVDFAVDPASVPADPVLLRSVLTNLFDNAVDYTPERGAIRIAFDNTDGRAAFSISNPAGNLEPADVAKLFDPFWRKEAARSGGQHVGLGLALSRTFAQAMGWTLSATLDAQRQLVLRLARDAAASQVLPAPSLSTP